MTVSQVLFSFQGRLCRREYWLKGILVLLPLGIISNILWLTGGYNHPNPLSVVISIVCMWPGMALVVKRLHDHDHSGWFFATMLIPFAGIIFAIWILVEVWFLRGTVGPNRFGNDPLQEDGALSSPRDSLENDRQTAQAVLEQFGSAYTPIEISFTKVSEVHCWSCKKELPVTDSNRGTKTKCPNCGAKQKLPK